MQRSLLGSFSFKARRIVLPLALRRDEAEQHLWVPLVVSICLHAALLVVLVLWFSDSQAPPKALGNEGAVELVLVEHKGSGPPAAPVTPTPPAPVQGKLDQPEAPPNPPIPAEDAEEPVSPPAPPSTAPAVASTPRPPLTLRQAPQISLGGNDETDAIALGPHVIPASVDAKYHNREPDYPPDAARRAQQGAVILLIHVSPDGLPSGVEVEQTSGFVSLDRAARDAVLTWHFLPAVRDGTPVAFDMAFRVVFHLE
jgi:periplasmic protein TonB